MVLKARWASPGNSQAVEGQTSRHDMESLETASCVRRGVMWTRSVSESIDHANC